MLEIMQYGYQNKLTNNIKTSKSSIEYQNKKLST
jgi:hypothetical protein